MKISVGVGLRRACHVSANSRLGSGRA